MKILYISTHSILERDEISLFASLGHDVFSLGAYTDPSGHPSLPRPGIPELKFHEDLQKESTLWPRTEMPESFLNKFDCIIVMHTPAIITQNWPRLRGRKVIWRSIGQSTQGVEETLAPMRNEGMKIVRMSSKETNILKYIGADIIIPFYKDSNELGGWNGEDKKVVNFSQSLKGRRLFCHYDQIMEMIAGYPAKIYGTGNEDLGNLNGGELTWDLMKGKLRDSRVFVYGGTWPSPYTLALQEAMMTGIPVVALGRRLAEELPGVPHMDYYEVDGIIKNGENGFVSDDMSALRSYIYQLLNDDELAKKIGEAGRQTAMQLWDREKIVKEWDSFLKTL